MIKKVILTILAITCLFLLYVSTRSGKFNYERSGVINAPAEKIYPYISNFKLGGEWSPYEKGIKMPKSYAGTDGTVGSSMTFGPSDSGSGKLEILELVPNQMVKIRLLMTAPFNAENLVIYKLTPEGTGTRFSWSMEGDGGFMTKLMTVFIDCEKMVAGQFSQGIQNLKTLVESQPKETGMKLTDTPVIVTVPTEHYVYIEKIGPFQKTAKPAWDEAHQMLKVIGSSAKKIGAMALFKMKPQMVYRAGFVFDVKPANIPTGAQYVQFPGGKYSKFVSTGSYMNLGPAWGLTMENAQKQKINVRDDFYIENYVNDPATTPEAQLVTELMIPTN